METCKNIKTIDIKEFRSMGLLQEVNRLFFHPRGLALSVIINNETGEEKLGGIWDSREDPEGFIFGPGQIDDDKIEQVGALFSSKIKARMNGLGFVIQQSEKEIK